MARILQVCNTDFYLTHFLWPLIRALDEAGHEVEAVCEGSAVPDALRDHLRAVHPFSFPKKGSPLSFARGIRRLGRIIRAGGFDCVNSHNRNASIIARVAAFQARVPLNLYTAHGYYFHDDQSRIAREATIALEGLLARLTDHTLSQSVEDVDIMVGRRLLEEDAVTIVKNGIDAERFRPRFDRAAEEARLSLSPGRFRFGTVGRLVEGKGFGDLVEAFGRLAEHRGDVELLLIGGNITQDIAPHARQLEDRARALGLQDRVRVTGVTDEVERYLATCDVFVLPSYREGLPRVVLEAMAMELAVIATDIRGCREAVQHGHTGFLYPPHDVGTLARLMRRMVDMSEEERRSFGENGRRRVLEQLTEAQYIQRQVEAIERLLVQRATFKRDRRRGVIHG